MYIPDVQYRKAKQLAFCRVCEKHINKGEDMVSWYTTLNRGQHIHIHPLCVMVLSELVKENIQDNPPMSGREKSEL